MWQRILTALWLLPLVTLALFWPDVRAWGLFSALVWALGVWEWGGLLAFSPWARRVWALVTLTVGGLWVLLPEGLTVSLTPYFHCLLLVASLFWLLVVPVWVVKQWRLAKQRQMAMILGWLLLAAAFFALRFWRAEGAWEAIMLMLVVWIADSSAYFAGRAWGRRLLAPTVSPKKTWEGVVGALLATSAYAWFWHGHSNLLQHWPVWAVLVLTGILTWVSVQGDLLESLFKRQAQIKDSSQLLPGHGGVLDRIDALMAVVVVASAVMLWHAGAVFWPV